LKHVFFLNINIFTFVEISTFDLFLNLSLKKLI
jgi:hypothetical protein